MSNFERQSLSMACTSETLLLHPEHVVFWPARKILFVADVHVGKEHRFGRSGIAIPGGVSEKTLQDLFSLCVQCAAERLIVLGDFMHAKPSADESWLKVLSQLLTVHPLLQMDIVAGNHDKPAGRPLLDKRIQWHQETLMEGPFVLQHEPGDDTRGYVISGHLHPAWRFSTSRRNGIRSPVFWFRKGHAVLPAFGGFTGSVNIDPDPVEDRIFMAGKDHVIEIPASARQSGNRQSRRRRGNAHPGSVLQKSE